MNKIASFGTLDNRFDELSLRWIFRKAHITNIYHFDNRRETDQTTSRVN